MSYPNDGWADVAWHNEVLKRLRELTKIAEGEGIILAHENCSGWGGLSHQNCLRLVEEINSTGFKVLFDTGNPPVEGQDSLEFYNAVKEHIVYVHIKDGKLEGGKAVFTFPGEGNGYVKDILAGLKNSGYDEGISIEPHLTSVVHKNKGIADEAESARVYVEYGRRLEQMI